MIEDFLKAFTEGLLNGFTMLAFILAWLTPFLLFAVLLKLLFQ